MRIECYRDGAAFYENVASFLTEKEIRSSLFIGIAARGRTDEDTSDWLMVVVRDAVGEIQLAGIMMPPRGLILDMRNGVANYVCQQIGYERIGELVEIAYI